MPKSDPKKHHGTEVIAGTTTPKSNRLKSLSNPVVNRAHLATGQTTADEGRALYSYYLSGRPKSIMLTGNAKEVNFQFDANGQRLRKYVRNLSAGAWVVDEASQIQFFYDPAGHLLGEYDKTGAALREYVWLGDIPVAVLLRGGRGGAETFVYYIHTDHLDTPRVVMDTSGFVRWRWFADPFGIAPPETNPSNLGVFVQNLRMPGQYADAETGLFYNRFRDYDPMIGRYVESDPIGLAGGINTYAYVGSHPTMGIDPTGLLEHFMMELNSQSTSSLECGCRESYKAFSGNPPYRNDPDSTAKKDIGAAPEGWYYIVDRPAGGMGSRTLNYFRGRSDWFALYRDDGSPGDDTVESGVVRREIRLHPKGRLGNSFGCVTLENQADFNRLRERLLKTKTGIIPGTGIKYYGTILLYRPGVGGGMVTNAKRVGIGLILAVSISFVAAAVFVRSPALWPLMPRWMDEAVGLLFKVHTQEEENSFEFLSAWLLCFLLLALVAIAAVALWRWREHSSNS